VNVLENLSFDNMCVYFLCDWNCKSKLIGVIIFVIAVEAKSKFSKSIEFGLSVHGLIEYYEMQSSCKSQL
jgi:hypothetical protein